MVSLVVEVQDCLWRQRLCPHVQVQTALQAVQCSLQGGVAGVLVALEEIGGLAADAAVCLTHESNDHVQPLAPISTFRVGRQLPQLVLAQQPPTAVDDGATIQHGLLCGARRKRQRRLCRCGRGLDVVECVGLASLLFSTGGKPGITWRKTLICTTNRHKLHTQRLAHRRRATCNACLRGQRVRV